MPRRLNFVERPWQPFELLFRCQHSRLLMRPGDECSRRVLGVLGRALELYGEHVHLYFAGGTSNHLHLIAAFESAEWKARFKCHIKANISKELGDLFDWSGNHWDRRAHDIPILDDSAFIDRLAYLASHGVKDNLVSCPGSWPGIQWVRAVTEGKPLVGVWYDRTALYALRRAWENAPRATRGRRPTLDDVAIPKTVHLTPPPLWAELDAPDLRARWVELVELALERHPAPLPHRIIGPKALVDADPHQRPARTKKAPAPWVFTRCRGLRRAWRAAYAAFVEAYGAAVDALRMGLGAVGFPAEGCRPAVLLARDAGG